MTPPTSALERAPLAACPICGSQPVRNGRGKTGGVLCVGNLIQHRLQTYGATQEKADAAWNHRPLEDALARRAEAAEWQDISTAPKDGIWVDLWVANFSRVEGGYRVSDAAWFDGKWRESTTHDDCDCEPAEDWQWFEGYGPTLPVETTICKATHWRKVEPPAARALLTPIAEGR